MSKIKIELDVKDYVLNWIKSESLKNGISVEDYISLVQESSYIQSTQNPNFTIGVLLKRGVKFAK